MDLDAAVSHARADYAAARPASHEWDRRARDAMPGANTRSVLHFDPFPFRVASAEGCLLHDVDGHQYLDLLGNYTAGLLGHSPEPVRRAAIEAIEGGWSYGSVHRDEVRLAEHLIDRFDSIEQVRFTNSGTEANLMALAVALHHTQRDHVLVFRSGYHGGVLTFGEEPAPVDVPHHWVLCDYNDFDSVADAFDAHGERIGAVLVEPMQGSGGCIPALDGFLDALRSHCEQSGALLIFDEVMTSRFSWGGAQQLVDVAPDITTLGKYVAGGFTFGAFGGSRDVMCHFDTGGSLGHAGTFNNNVVSMAAGCATADLLVAETLETVHARGDRLRRSLEDAFESMNLPMSVSGQGSLMNVHGTPGPVTSTRDLHDADDRLRELFFFHCLERGFYIARRGFIALSTEITDAHAGAFIDAVREFRPAAAPH
ncbi:MAG: aspartate aminotransferase family protein [Ilumatobacter sp.]